MLLGLLCLGVLTLAAAAALSLGDYRVPLEALPGILWHGGDSNAAFVVHELRLPRLLTGLLAGAALGMAGAIAQSITRNPLGEPGLLGVTAGAAFAMVLGMAFARLSTPAMLACGTLGGLFAALLTFAIGLRTRLEPLQLTLVGMSVNLFFLSAITLVLVSSQTEANGIYYWLSGSLANRTWEHVGMLWAWVLGGLALGLACARILDLLALDETMLTSLGLQVTRWRLLLGLTAVVLSAATVAATGPIAFVGLVAPHLVRSGLTLAGERTTHRTLLPLSALAGASLVCGADLIAKWQEIPVGILCVLVGGPLLVHLIRRQGT
ncbi:putative siderophore transport system permease protein [Imhoffiella purpurea]|uniref:Putative siderophore transport system permease protein n=1 Tax=Imhoffiella purpurea TaxID=1249627 RepID=W9VAY0_9GAMM|nr:putative siderophore transport system permease protein [Imhoffiella purpurea]